MNQVFLIGNLTRDPELSATSNGVNFSRFSIAVSRDYKNEDGSRDTDFLNCIAWRGLAENLTKYQKKGAKIAVSGSIQTSTYEDENGNKRNSFTIVATGIEFLSSKKPEEGEPSPQPIPSRPQQPAKPKVRPTLEAFDDDGSAPF